MASGAVKPASFQSAMGTIRSTFHECQNWFVQEEQKQMQITLAARKRAAGLERKNEETEKQVHVSEEDEMAAPMVEIGRASCRERVF